MVAKGIVATTGEGKWSQAYGDIEVTLVGSSESEKTMTATTEGEHALSNANLATAIQHAVTAKTSSQMPHC